MDLVIEIVAIIVAKPLDRDSECSDLLLHNNVYWLSRGFASLLSEK